MTALSSQPRSQSAILVLTAERRFVLLYAIVLLVAFSPFKALGQISALIGIFGLVCFVGISPANHFIKFLFFGIVYTCVGLGYALLRPTFLLANYLLFLVTSASFLVLLCNFTSIASASLLRRLGRLTLIVLIVEALYGIVQAFVAMTRSGSFDIGNGDLVRGTIDSSFEHTASASNSIYAILLSSLLVFSFAVSKERVSPWRVGAYILVLLAWLLASVMHTIIFFVIAVVGAFVVRWLIPAQGSVVRKRRGCSFAFSSFAFIGSLLFVLALTPVMLPRNLATAPVFFYQTLDIGPYASSEKARATYATLFFVPLQAPYQPLIGLGPGQYSSRASLIRSGQYLRQASLPFVRPAATPEADYYILSLWHQFMNSRPNGGSTYFPFYSWLSLYGELGALGVAGVLLVTGWAIVQLCRRDTQTFPRLTFALLVLLIYFGLLGLQDNYWEFTQAVFPAALLWKLGYDYARKEQYLRLMKPTTVRAEHTP